MQPVRLGNHELLIRLASGGAANVFLVRDLQASPPGRLLALKILLPSLASNEDFLNMFFTEARIAAQLRHQNVVAIAGFGQVDGIHCLAMEYVFGPSLAQVLRASAKAKKPLTVGVLLRIAACVCDALHYAHELADKDGTELHLVHRDVTPQNILIGFNGVPKLTDFGIAKATNRGWETQAGIVKGKFSYMSPEQAVGKKVDRRSDIFGTGIVLWEALTGRDLFRGSTPMEVLTAIREQKIDPPSKVVAGLTPIVDPIVMKALKRAPKGRYQTAAEMRDEIEDLIRRAGVEIDAQTISREFAAIYGDEIVERAFALRAAMAGKPDIEQLARVLGGSPLNPKHLPVIPGGLTNPDPLGLFSEELPAPARAPSEREKPASVLPARVDRSFGTTPSLDDFEIVEDEEEPPFEADPPPREERSAPPMPEERLVTGWDDSTAMAVPDDELLSMLSAEDATIGFLPPEFAERFGRDLKLALDEEAQSFEDEMTVGMPDSGLFSAPRMVSDDDDSVSMRWDDLYSRGIGGAKTEALPRPSLRPVPRAPSLALDVAMAPRALRSLRPRPRAPSLDMEGDSTPVPELDTTYDPMIEEPLLPSRSLLAAPPPPPARALTTELEVEEDDAATFDAGISEPRQLVPPDDVLPSMPGLPVMTSGSFPEPEDTELFDDLGPEEPRSPLPPIGPSPIAAGPSHLLSPEALLALTRAPSPAPPEVPPREVVAPSARPASLGAALLEPVPLEGVPPKAEPVSEGPKRIEVTPMRLLILMLALLAAGTVLGLALGGKL